MLIGELEWNGKEWKLFDLDGRKVLTGLILFIISMMPWGSSAYIHFHSNSPDFRDFETLGTVTAYGFAGPKFHLDYSNEDIFRMGLDVSIDLSDGWEAREGAFDRPFE